MLRPVYFLILLAALLVLPFVGSIAQAEDVAASPLDRPMPEYPAAADTAEGSVKLAFKIDADGRTGDITVVEATPPGLFDVAALAAVRQWRYHPRTEDGKPVEQPGNSILLKFRPPTTDTTLQPIWNVPAYYPPHAFDQKLEGDGNDGVRHQCDGPGRARQRTGEFTARCFRSSRTEIAAFNEIQGHDGRWQSEAGFGPKADCPIPPEGREAGADPN